MTYHVVFDISDRLPEVVIGAVAFVCAVVVVALALRPGGRRFLRSSSWFWAGLAGALWFALDVHNIGGGSGLLFGAGFGGFALVVAVLARMNLNLPIQSSPPISARSAGPVVAFLFLLFTSLLGCRQLTVLDLSRRLESGEATVVTGTVEKSWGYTWASQCFTISAQEFCVVDSPSFVGFHQAANDGGPIHDCL